MCRSRMTCRAGLSAGRPIDGAIVGGRGWFGFRGVVWLPGDESPDGVWLEVIHEEHVTGHTGCHSSHSKWEGTGEAITSCHSNHSLWEGTRRGVGSGPNRGGGVSPRRAGYPHNHGPNGLPFRPSKREGASEAVMSYRSSHSNWEGTWEAVGGGPRGKGAYHRGGWISRVTGQTG